MRITSNEVRNVVNLARLAIKNSEVESDRRDLSCILDLVNQMNVVDTTGVQPMAHPLETTERMRPDVVTEDNQRDILQSVAPRVEAGLYLVPRIIE